jgi:hypothetical protein
MNQPSQRSLVFAERERSIKGRLVVAAVDTSAVAHQQLSAGQTVTAQDALRCAHWMNFGEAFFAYRNPRDVG